MTKAALIKANKIEEEINFISTFVLPQLNDVYYKVVDYMDVGYKELDVGFYFDRTITTILTTENVLKFIQTEIKTVTKHKERLEKSSKNCKGAEENMIAVLAWCDGFGNDTLVKGIFPTIEEARVFAGDDVKGKVEKYWYAYRWQAFDYGPVEFDWELANDF